LSEGRRSKSDEEGGERAEVRKANRTFFGEHSKLTFSRFPNLF